MLLAALTPEGLLHICRNLRACDRAELFAQRFEDDAEAFAGELALAIPRAIFAMALLADDGEPVAFVVLFLAAPGLASVSLLATGRFAEIGRPAHRFLRRVVRDRVFQTLRRVECRALAANHATRRWLRKLGFREERRLKLYGKAGEDFVQLAWLNPSFKPVGA